MPIFPANPVREGSARVTPCIWSAQERGSRGRAGWLHRVPLSNGRDKSCPSGTRTRVTGRERRGGCLRDRHAVRPQEVKTGCGVGEEDVPAQIFTRRYGGDAESLPLRPSLRLRATARRLGESPLRV